MFQKFIRENQPQALSLGTDIAGDLPPRSRVVRGSSDGFWGHSVSERIGMLESICKPIKFKFRASAYLTGFIKEPMEMIHYNARGCSHTAV